MKHKVKITVLDTKLYPEYQQQYCVNPCSANALSTTRAMSSCSIVMTSGMTSGTVDSTRS